MEDGWEWTSESLDHLRRLGQHESETVRHCAWEIVDRVMRHSRGSWPGRAVPDASAEEGGLRLREERQGPLTIRFRVVPRSYAVQFRRAILAG